MIEPISELFSPCLSSRPALIYYLPIIGLCRQRYSPCSNQDTTELTHTASVHPRTVKQEKTQIKCLTQFEISGFSQIIFCQYTFFVLYCLGKFFGCDSSPRSPNVCLSVCVSVRPSHFLQLYYFLKDFCRTSEGLPKDFQRTSKGL